MPIIRCTKKKKGKKPNDKIRWQNPKGNSPLTMWDKTNCKWSTCPLSESTDSCVIDGFQLLSDFLSLGNFRWGFYFNSYTILCDFEIGEGQVWKIRKCIIQQFILWCIRFRHARVFFSFPSFWCRFWFTYEKLGSCSTIWPLLNFNSQIQQPTSHSISFFFPWSIGNKHLDWYQVFFVEASFLILVWGYRCRQKVTIDEHLSCSKSPGI